MDCDRLFIDQRVAIGWCGHGGKERFSVRHFPALRCNHREKVDH